MKIVSKKEILVIGNNAKEASRSISLLEPKLKNDILRAASENLLKNMSIIIDENKKDVHEIKAEYLKGLKFYYISSMNEISNLCLKKEKYKNYIDL